MESINTRSCSMLVRGKRWFMAKVWGPENKTLMLHSSVPDDDMTLTHAYWDQPRMLMTMSNNQKIMNTCRRPQPRNQLLALLVKSTVVNFYAVLQELWSQR